MLYFKFFIHQLLGNSQKEYEKHIEEYSIKTQQRYRGNLGKYFQCIFNYL